MRVPVLALVFGILAVGLLAGSITYGSPGGARVDLVVTPVPAGAGRVELEVRWRWTGRPALLKRWIQAWVNCGCLGADPDDLLAITFDTRHWAYVGDDAPFGRGGYGPHIRRLEAVRGLDGARRLYFIPVGRDGRVRVAFAAKDADAGDPAGFLVDFVHDFGREGWVLSRTVSAP